MILVLYAHKFLMVLAAALLIYAVSRAYKRGDSWLAGHQKFALLGVTAGLFGFAAIVVFKYEMGYPHFKSIHALAGLAAVLSFTGAPLAGRLIVAGMNRLRPLHKAGGWLAAFIVVLSALLKIF